MKFGEKNPFCLFFCQYKPLQNVLKYVKNNVPQLPLGVGMAEQLHCHNGQSVRVAMTSKYSQNSIENNI